MLALWAGGRRCCTSATAKPGLQVACIPCYLSKRVQVGEVHLILVQLGATLPTHGYSQRQESGSTPLSFKYEVKCKMSLFVLFRLAWRTALGSFPASWRMTILLSLYTSRCSVGICRSTVRALHKCLRGEGEILKLSLVGISAAVPHVQPLSLCRKDFCPVALQSPATANYSPISFPDTTGMRGEGRSLNHSSLRSAHYWISPAGALPRSWPWELCCPRHAGVTLKHPSAPSPPLISWFPMETHFWGWEGIHYGISFGPL